MKNYSPRAKILTFLALTFSLSLPFYYLILKVGIMSNSLYPLALMWCPGIAGLLCSYLFGHKFQDIGFRKGKLKYYVAAYTVPALIALFIILGLLIFGLGQFEISPKAIERHGSVGKVLLFALIVAPVLGIWVNFFAALGEEMGWRGFLYTQMHAAKVKHADYLIGFIWSLWHWPIILMGDYATSSKPLLSACMFSVALIASGPFYGWLRGKSGSVFPLALTHASHNLFIQAIYPAFIKKGPLDEFFGGESGVFCMVAYVALAIIFHRKNLARS